MRNATRSVVMVEVGEKVAWQILLPAPQPLVTHTVNTPYLVGSSRRRTSGRFISVSMLSARAVLQTQ